MRTDTADTDDDADEAADDRERQGLDEELGEDVAAARADRLADADLAGPLADRHQHDVHDPDAARPGARSRRCQPSRIVSSALIESDRAQQLRLVGDA